MRAWPIGFDRTHCQRRGRGLCEDLVERTDERGIIHTLSGVLLEVHFFFGELDGQRRAENLRIDVRVEVRWLDLAEMIHVDR